MREFNSSQTIRVNEHSRSRDGITLLEVIFSVGVLLAGLVGLAAVLPVASNNARQTLDTNRITELAENQQELITGIITNQSGTHVQAFSTDADQFGTNGLFNVVPTLPPSFCYDPWFLTAAYPRRPTDNPPINSYDRTVFPCYDDHYGPDFSPSNALNTGTRNAASGTGINRATPIVWSRSNHIPIVPGEARRIRRISFGGSVNLALAQIDSRDRDTVSVIQPSRDSTILTGLFVKRHPGSSDYWTTQQSGRYSFMITAANSANTDTYRIISFRDREVVNDPTGSFSANSDRFNLTPFVAQDGLANNPPAGQVNFQSERLGYVSSAAAPIANGRGTFTFRVHQTVDPTVTVNDYVCLIRRLYNWNTATSQVNANANGLLIGWYKILNVNTAPALTGASYFATITVQGAPWTFHPVQRYPEVAGPYEIGVDDPASYDSGNPGSYSETFSGGGGGTTNGGDTGTLGDPLYGTEIVLMRNVISVDRF